MAFSMSTQPPFGHELMNAVQHELLNGTQREFTVNGVHNE